MPDHPAPLVARRHRALDVCPLDLHEGISPPGCVDGRRSPLYAALSWGDCTALAPIDVAKKTGTSTGGIETSARYKRRQARRRRAEEAEWAAKSGPVEIRYLDDVVRGEVEALVDEQRGATVDGESSSSSPPS